MLCKIKEMANILQAFWNSDGAMLIVPQMGTLTITTECGRIRVSQHEICCIPQGIKFSVQIHASARGFVCNFLLYF